MELVPVERLEAGAKVTARGDTRRSAVNVDVFYGRPRLPVHRYAHTAILVSGIVWSFNFLNRD